MRVFLTGNDEPEWRWEIEDFLQENQIDFFNRPHVWPEQATIFKYLKILEGCDALIAYLRGGEPQHLETILELSYASKLAKTIMVVNGINDRHYWIRTLPYTVSFADLDGLKRYVTTRILAAAKKPRLVG